MWRENVYRGVGHSNGQLILFEKDSCEGAYLNLEFSTLTRFWDKFRYNLEDGLPAVGFNPFPDDLASVPKWSTVDISIPRESKILSWYIYTPDFPGDYIDADTCDICDIIGPHEYCPKYAPKRLRLDLSSDPHNF